MLLLNPSLTFDAVKSTITSKALPNNGKPVVQFPCDELKPTPATQRRRLLIANGNRYFRLRNKETGQCIYSDSSDTLSYELCDRLSEQQYWTINDITSDYAFKLRNKLNDECIYSVDTSAFSAGLCANSDAYYWSLTEPSYADD